MDLLQIYYPRFMYLWLIQESNLLLSALICKEGTKRIYTFDLNPDIQKKNEKENDVKVKSKIVF